MKKVGRNDPCPCGSGKKFKKCCESKMIGKRFMAKKIDETNVEKSSSNLFSLFHKSVDQARKIEKKVTSLGVHSVKIKDKEQESDIPSAVDPSVAEREKILKAEKDILSSSKDKISPPEGEKKT